MVCCCCCCDPHKLAYISGIITAIEAFGFSIINILLICVANCSLTVPSEALSGTLKNFLGWYFYGNTTDCTVDWISTLDEYPSTQLSETSPEANYNYQITYLVLHVVWFISSLIMIYGNARKRWGYYVPWLLITLALLIMDVVIVSFYGREISTIDFDNVLSDVGGIPSMALALSLYSRGIVFWFMNLTEFGTVMNAFCKSYHKRSKQERQQKKQEKKERAQQYHQEASMAGQRAVTTPPTAPTTVAPASSAPPRNPLAAPGPSAVYGYPQGGQDFGVYDNPGFMSDHPPVFPEQAPPPPRVPPRVPSELLPFSYLNPGFRPNHPHDVDGMRAGGKTHGELGYMSDDGGPKRAPPLPSYGPTPDGFGDSPYPPPPRHVPPPPEAFQRRHDSLRNLPSFPQNARQARPYSSLRNRPGAGPSQDPRPPSEYAEPWDQKQQLLSQIEQLKGLPRVNLKVAPPVPSKPRSYNNPPASNHGSSAMRSNVFY